jgi:O-antigen/teichoic acid export membrane protein
MGVIVRQTLKASTVNYAAAAVGVVNTFFLFTLCFTESQLGQIRYIQEVAALVASFCSLGVFNVVVRFFPEFQTEDGKNNALLTIGVIALGVGLAFFLVGVYLFSTILPKEISENIGVIAVTTAAIVYGSLFFYYSTNYGLIAIPSLLRNLYIKVGLALGGIVYFFAFVDYNDVLSILGAVYATSTLILAWYLWRKGNFGLSMNFSFFTKDRIRRISTYAGFGILGTLSSGLANKIDVFMVTDMLNFSRTGVYSIALNASNLLVVSTGAILAISGPIVAKSMKNNDIKDVEVIYKKAGLNLFLFGSFLMLLLWSNIDAIFELIPNGEKYESGKVVILILGLAKLFDMVTSVNEVIIAYSKYFRFNLYALFVLAVLNIIANLIFIPQFDIAGAALATMMSVVLYNTLKTVYIYIKFGIHPFQVKLISVAVLTLGSYGLSLLFPPLSSPFLSILLKGSLITSFFVFFMLKMNISDEATKLWRQVKSKLQAIFDK